MSTSDILKHLRQVYSDDTDEDAVQSINYKYKSSLDFLRLIACLNAHSNAWLNTWFNGCF